jgi:hypothetical protein
MRLTACSRTCPDSPSGRGAAVLSKHAHASRGARTRDRRKRRWQSPLELDSSEPNRQQVSFNLL